MIKNLQQVATLAALGGAMLIGCADDEPTTCDGADCPDDGCPTDGCPTDGCPTDGCPTDGCPTDGCPTDGCPTSGFAADYETSAAFFTQMSGPVSGGAGHPDNQMWYSESLRASIEAGGDFTAPVGATALKAHTEAGAVTGYTVMTKQAAGFDPDNNDWFYEARDAAGAVTSSGMLSGCISCHEAAPGTDYLLGTTVTN